MDLRNVAVTLTVLPSERSPAVVCTVIFTSGKTCFALFLEHTCYVVGPLINNRSSSSPQQQQQQ